jgi:hypothetical protein
MYRHANIDEYLAPSILLAKDSQYKERHTQFAQGCRDSTKGLGDEVELYQVRYLSWVDVENVTYAPFQSIEC